MADALIGSTGLVGGTMLRQRPFDDLSRSTDSDRIAGRCFDPIWSAGAPAEKWEANRDPDTDRANLRRLADALLAAEARRVVLISTADLCGRTGPYVATADEVVDGIRSFVAVEHGPRRCD